MMKISMFDFLADSTMTSALPAGHYAIQFIRQWAATAARVGRKASIEGLPPEQLDLAKRIVTEIEEKEGKPVAKISEAKIADYVNSISGRLQELARKERHVDLAKGAALLKELRSVS